MASLGHEVRIYATTRTDLPLYESIEGVEYVRSSWNMNDTVIAFLSGRPSDWRRRERQKQIEAWYQLAQMELPEEYQSEPEPGPLSRLWKNLTGGERKK